MQRKVSMVMPCYNKEAYIGEMFDSVIKQEWNTIELIIVNDGSTDGTREIIAEYESKIHRRGFELVIIDQENAGVCAAAKTGLERITGDYVCLVDADDELDPKYVSTLAGWLEENQEYDIAACDGVQLTSSGKSRLFVPFNAGKTIIEKAYILEQYLLTVFRPTVWIYMVRTEYFHRCRITKTYYTLTNGTHEPGYIIPLLAYGGELYFFSLPLYRFNALDESHSRSKAPEQVSNFYNEYHKLDVIAMEALPRTILSEDRLARLKKVSMLARSIQCYVQTKKISDDDLQTDVILDRIIEHTNEFWTIKPPISRDLVKGMERWFFWALSNALTGVSAENVSIPAGRIIGYGALGRAAYRLLPRLKGTNLEPTELWDISGDGNNVQLPDFNTLREDDMVLVFPTGEIEAELRERFKNMSFMTIYNHDIWKWAAWKLLKAGD